MCSQPIVHDAQLSRATRRSSCSSSAASFGAPSNEAALKLRVGSVLIALKERRFASVPSSRYLAVAGPKERPRRSFAAASTARGPPVGGLLPLPLTATPLMFFEPSTAPRPPRP